MSVANHPPPQSSWPWPTLADSLPAQVCPQPSGRPVPASPAADEHLKSSGVPHASTTSAPTVGGGPCDTNRAVAMELKLVLANVSLELPPNIIADAHHSETPAALLAGDVDRRAAIWSARIAPVLTSLQSFVALVLSLPTTTSLFGSDQVALVLQPQVHRQQLLIDSLLGALFTPATTSPSQDTGLDLVLTPHAIRKAAAQAAVSPVPVPLANLWGQYLVQDVKHALEFVATAAEADCAKVQHVFQRLIDHVLLERRQHQGRDDNSDESVAVPNHEREYSAVDVALAAEEPLSDQEVGLQSPQQETSSDNEYRVAGVQSEAGICSNSVCDSPRPVTHFPDNSNVNGIISETRHPASHLQSQSPTPTLSTDSLAAIIQVYAHLHKTCLSAITRLTALQLPPTVCADLEAEIYRARLEHVLWNMYLGQSGGMFAAALAASKPEPPAPVLNVMPTLAQGVSPAAPPGGMPSRIPVPVRHVIVPGAPAPTDKQKGRARRRHHHAESVSLHEEEEEEGIEMHTESEYSSEFEADGGDEDELGADHHEPEPPRSKGIRGGGDLGSTSLKLPTKSSSSMLTSFTSRNRANTLDTVPTVASVSSSTSTRKPRTPTRAPLTQPPWSISSASRPRSTSTNASTSTFGGTGRVRPRVSSFRGTLRSPSPPPSTGAWRPTHTNAPHVLHHSPTSPTLRTLARPASTPSLLAAMAMSPSTPSLHSSSASAATNTVPVGGPGFFPPFIPAGNLGLGDADVAKQRVYNRLSSWHLSGKEADKIAERQAMYEERFRAAALAAVAANRLAASTTSTAAGKGRGKEVGGVAPASLPVGDDGRGDDPDGAADPQQDARQHLEAAMELPPAAPGVDPSHFPDNGSRTASPAPSVTTGKVMTLVQQIEQVGLGDERQGRSHERSGSTSDDD